MINPYTVGQKIEKPFERHVYPSEKDRTAIKNNKLKEKDARKSLDKYYSTQFPCKYYKKYDPDTFQKLSYEDKMQVWSDAVSQKQAKRLRNMETGKVIRHHFKTTTTNMQFLPKKKIEVDPYVIVKPPKHKKCCGHAKKKPEVEKSDDDDDIVIA